MAIEKKNQNPGVRFGATRTALPIQSIWPIFVVNGLDWQCCLDGSSKTAPRILIVSIAMGANYSFVVINIEIWAPTFFKHNNSSIATVTIVRLQRNSIIPNLKPCNLIYHRFV